MILATKNHNVSDDSLECRILLDADIAILGDNPNAYQAYVQSIRMEYAWVPEEQYLQGRAALLQAFLMREHIYLTTPMVEAREEQARRNLKQEIAALAS